MISAARKIVCGLLAASFLAAQLLMAQHMALHFDGDAHPARAAVQAAQTKAPALHAQQKDDDDNCAVCFFAKFILSAMAVAAVFLLLPRLFGARRFSAPGRFALQRCLAAYDACGPPVFPA